MSENRLRFTVVYEFDYHAEVTQEGIDDLIRDFMKDPSEFINPLALEWDERLYIDVEDITNAS